jgi:hypothetical protein
MDEAWRVRVNANDVAPKVYVTEEEFNRERSLGATLLLVSGQKRVLVPNRLSTAGSYV